MLMWMQRTTRMRKPSSCRGARLFHLDTGIAVRKLSLLVIGYWMQRPLGVKNTMGTSKGISRLQLR